MCLHNYLRQTNNACYCPVGFADSEDSAGQIRPGEWTRIVREGCNGALRPLCRPRGSRYQQSAVSNRENLKEYLIHQKVLSSGNGTMSGPKAIKYMRFPQSGKARNKFVCALQARQ